MVNEQQQEDTYERKPVWQDMYLLQNYYSLYISNTDGRSRSINLSMPERPDINFNLGAIKEGTISALTPAKSVTIDSDDYETHPIYENGVATGGFLDDGRLATLQSKIEGQLLSNYEIKTMAPHLRFSDQDASKLQNLKTKFDEANNSIVSYGVGCRFLPGANDYDNCIYAYATPLTPLKQWMKSMGAEFPDAPLFKWMMPGAREAGMSSLKDPENFWQYMSEADAGMKSFMSQKDSIYDLLQIGIRYFDFKPGYCVEGGTELYHQYKNIAGISYKDFLNDIKRFLIANTSEIVFIALSFEEFENDTMKPNADKLTQDYNDIFAGTQIIKGNRENLIQCYSDLIKSNIRIIFLNDISVPVDQADALSSKNNYDYANTSKDIHSKDIESLNVTMQIANEDYVAGAAEKYRLVIQTAAQVILPEFAISNYTAYLDYHARMSMKTRTDNTANQWLQENFRKPQNESTGYKNQFIAVVNDFSDNRLVQDVILCNQQRLKTPFEPGKIVSLFNSAQKKYVRVNTDGTVVAAAVSDVSALTAFDKWLVVRIAYNKIALYNQAAKRFLRLNGQGWVDATNVDTPVLPEGWNFEKFTPVSCGNGEWALYRMGICFGMNDQLQLFSNIISKNHQWPSGAPLKSWTGIGFIVKEVSL